MSYYGITAIRWNDDHTEVESCMVHELERQGRGFSVQEGQPLWYTDVISLINRGDKVVVLVKDTEGEYEQRETVQVRFGNDQYLESAPENALFDLPVF